MSNIVPLAELLELCAYELRPLSEMIVRGIPNWLNTDRNADVVASPHVHLSGIASIHLLWESTTTNNMNPSTGPAKSTCTLDHFSFVSGHGTGSLAGGTGATSAHFGHCLTIRSKSCQFRSTI